MNRLFAGCCFLLYLTTCGYCATVIESNDKLHLRDGKIIEGTIIFRGGGQTVILKDNKQVWVSDTNIKSLTKGEGGGTTLTIPGTAKPRKKERGKEKTVKPEAKPKDKKTVKSETKTDKTSSVSDVTWKEINKIYNLKSKFTDLQKTEHWKKYKGKKVKWTGTVASIGETFGTVMLQIKMNPETLVSDIIVSLKKEERSKALKLSQGDKVTFIGVMNRWGSILTYVSLDDGELVE